MKNTNFAMKICVRLAFLASLAGMSQQGFAQQKNLPKMELKSFEATGTGCTNRNTTYIWTKKDAVLNVTYGDFTAGDETGRTELDCTLRLEFVVPKGYKMGSLYVESEGFHDPQAGPSQAILREQTSFFGTESEEKAVGFIPDLDYDWTMVGDELKFKMGSGCKETTAIFELRHRITTQPKTTLTIDKAMVAFRHFIKADDC